MIIYNVTINVDESIHEEWLEWMKNKHIDEVVATGCFSKATMVKVLVDEEMGGITYSVQYLAPSRDALEKYKNEFAPQLKREGLQRFSDKMLVFRTELEIISEH